MSIIDGPGLLLFRSRSPRLCDGAQVILRVTEANCSARVVGDGRQRGRFGVSEIDDYSGAVFDLATMKFAVIEV